MQVQRMLTHTSKVLIMVAELFHQYNQQEPEKEYNQGQEVKILKSYLPLAQRSRILRLNLQQVLKIT